MFRRTDRLFQRYQETREPRLLGAVFDRTAAELLRVALHLTRDRHRAEDVLQSTFLTAIEKTAQYDAARPLLPWLLEILANHARQMHRRERRLLPAPAQTHEGADAGDTAAANELAATCDRAIDALPEPYRQVLILHLRHGLSGQEIAAVLTRPDSTVRNQIARGLDLLRRKLPAGLTAAVAIGAGGGRGLAAVRSEVLARVPVPAGGAGAIAAAASASLFGVLFMGNKVAVSLVLLALVAAGGWYSLGVAAPAAAPSPGRHTEVASAAAPTTDTALPAPPPVQREAATPSTGDTCTGSLIATLVVEGDGTPVADAACTVWRRTQNGPRRLVTQAVTRADGTVSFTLVPGTFVLELDVCGQQEGFTITAGDETRVRCEVRRGCRLEGTVVDTDGRPIGGAEIRRERRWSSVLLARTAADGTFAADHVNGRELVWAIGAGRQPSKRQGLERRGDRAEVRLVLGGAGTRMSGTVVDEQGEAAANAHVFIGLDTKRGPSTLVQFALHDLRADEAGRFAVDWLTPGRVCVAAVPDDQDLERATMRELVVEEAVPVQVQLRLGHGARINGIVRDEKGQPVAGADCEVSSHLSGLDLLSRRTVKTGTDGRFDVRGLCPGKNWVQANLGGMQVDTSIDLENGQTFEWNPVLGDGAPIAVRVLGPDEEPLPRQSVSVEVGGSMKENGGTDEQGRWRREHMPPVEYTLKVCTAGVVVAQSTIVPGPEEVVIRIDPARMPSARISGRVVDARGNPVGDCDVSLSANSGWVSPQHVEKDGRFRTDLLPPGVYGFSASARTSGLGWAVASATLVAKEERDLGDIVLPATASVSVRLRAPDGTKVRDALLRLGDLRETASGTDFFEPDEVDGVYRKTGFNPGKYVLCLLGPEIAPQSVPLTLLAGERRELDVVAERGVPVVFELRCRLDPPHDNGLINCQMSLVDARGDRVVNHHLFGYFDDHAQRKKCVRLGLLAGTYRVHVEEFGGKTKELEITVPAVAPAAPIVLDLR